MIGKKLNYRWLVSCLIFLSLAGCAPSKRLIAKPVSGYDAIRFNQTFELRDHSINTYTFKANSILISDMEMEDDPSKIYCGLIPIDGAAIHTCIGLEGLDIIIINPKAGFKEVRRKVPEGALSLTKID